MSEIKVYGITQTDTPPKHDSQYMCDYKMVQLRSPCMDLDWPKQNDFHVVLKSDHDLAIRKLKREVELLREQRNWWISQYWLEESAKKQGIDEDAEIIKAIGEVL